MRRVVLDLGAPEWQVAKIDPLDDTYRALEWSLSHKPASRDTPTPNSILRPHPKSSTTNQERPALVGDLHLR